MAHGIRDELERLRRVDLELMPGPKGPIVHAECIVVAAPTDSGADKQSPSENRTSQPSSTRRGLHGESYGNLVGHRKFTSVQHAPMSPAPLLSQGSALLGTQPSLLLLSIAT